MTLNKLVAAVAVVLTTLTFVGYGVSEFASGINAQAKLPSQLVASVKQR